MGGWESVVCDLCGGNESRSLLEIPCEDAPGVAARILECAACGLRYLSPRPTVAAIGKYYPHDYGAYIGRRRGALKQRVWDFFRDCCSRTPAGPPRIIQAIIAGLVEWKYDINVRLDGPNTPRVLDVGCGFGDLLIYLASRGAEVVGVEPDMRACQRAKEYGLDVRPGTLLEQKFEKGRFDVVVMSHSLEHMHYPRAVMKEVHRVLRTGGLFHLAVPNGRSVGFREEGILWGALFFPIHLYHFDEGSLGRYLKEAGFKIVNRSYKTLCVDHKNSLTALAKNGHLGAALRIASRVTVETLQSRSVGDIVRMVAVAI